MSVYQEHSTTQCGLRPVVDDQGRPRTTGTRVHVCTRGCKLSTVDACSNKSTCATTSTAHAKRFDLLALEPCHRGEHKLGATRDPPNPIFHCGLDIWRNRRNPVRRIDPLVPSRAVLTGVSRCPRAHPHTQHCPLSLNKRFLDAGIATSGTMKRLPDTMVQQKIIQISTFPAMTTFRRSLSIQLGRAVLHASSSLVAIS